ncbi:Rrf2 family transcriptional regulator OS=Streptomyces tendae OX=1932 GN=GUR47_28425 PE=4 SV=1 [Streptomyces tendae]
MHFQNSIAGEMRRAGLDRNQRDCEGGFWLGRPADEITLLDVSRVVDGELLTLRGEAVAALDYPGAASRLPDVWRRVEADAAAVLGGVTVASLLPAGDALAVAGEAPAGKGAA